MLKLATLASVAVVLSSLSGTAMTVADAPIGLLCTSVVTDREGLFPHDPRFEDVQYGNRCISTVQGYVKTHCPKSPKTIWQQIEAVAVSGPGIPDAKALRAACR